MSGPLKIGRDHSLHTVSWGPNSLVLGRGLWEYTQGQLWVPRDIRLTYLHEGGGRLFLPEPQLKKAPLAGEKLGMKFAVMSRALMLTQMP